MVDRQIGDIISLLQDLEIDQQTIVFITGDNGGQDYFKTPDRPHGFFGPNLNPQTGKRFRAGKGSLYEGGLKVPFLVRWPNQIRAGSVSHHLFGFQDVMPTLAELTESTAPNTDGVSFLPTLLGKQPQPKHPFLYWEYRNQTAIRVENWKAIQNNQNDWELYDLSTDIEEKSNVADQNASTVSQLIALAASAHEPARIGQVYDRSVNEKDRRQAPHSRNLSPSKVKE